jgi:tetratricopeptide (TPR) repeat protein
LYEIIIIICFAIALFLLLRHYPEAKSGVNYFDKEHLRRFIAAITRGRRLKKREVVEQVLEANPNVQLPHEEVAKVVDSIREENKDLNGKLYEANQAYEADDLREAENLAIEAIVENKRCAPAYSLLGKIAFFRGQFDDAKEAYITAIKCDNSLGEAYFGLGRTELREENYTRALDNLQKSIALEGGHAEWYAELGKAFMGVRQYAKAAKVLKRASSLDIDNKEYRDLATEAEEKQRTHSYYTRGR